MIPDNAIADDLISGHSKRSPSYHRDYGGKTYGELKQLDGKKPPDMKARHMRKLIEQDPRLDQDKERKPRR